MDFDRKNITIYINPKGKYVFKKPTKPNFRSYAKSIYLILFEFLFDTNPRSLA